MTSNTPDPDFDLTYAAVGRAISAWEGLEVLLSHLYSILIYKPREIKIIIDYGTNGRIFKDRIRLLTTAAETYFVGKPDQEKEAKLDEIIGEAIILSIQRHQIAHGLVAKIPFVAPETSGDKTTGHGYALVPPWYGFHQLTKHNQKFYFYNSQNILAEAQRFQKCASRARVLAWLLSDPQKELAESVSQHDGLDSPQYVYYSQ